MFKTKSYGDKKKKKYKERERERNLAGENFS